MHHLNKLALLLLPILCASRSIEIVRTISNPHQDQVFESGTCIIGEDCPLVGTLDVSKIALDHIATQPGTFLGPYRQIVRGVEVRFFKTLSSNGMVEFRRTDTNLPLQTTRSTESGAASIQDRSHENNRSQWCSPHLG